MRRKVIGYDKTLELMKQGYELRRSPMGYSYYMYVGDEIITIRHDVFTKMLRNNINLIHEFDGWATIYRLEVK